MNQKNADLLKVDKLVSEVVGSSHTAPHRATVSGDDSQDVQRILNADYGCHLKRQFSPQELRAAVEVMRLSVPHLNRAQFRTEKLKQLELTAAELGARLMVHDFQGDDGLALLGFYVDERSSLRRPTIYLNSAHHPVAIATAFWHEVGHHLTARFVSDQREPLSLSLKADYCKHLDQPFELLADMLVCLAAYPKRSARRLFGSLLNSDGTGDATVWDELVRKSKRHLQIETGFEFMEDLPAAQNLHYLAGMLHFTKLRLALLSEYDV